MHDPLKMLEAKKAQVLARAQQEAAEIDRDIAELVKANEIAAKHGLKLVPASEVASATEVATEAAYPITSGAVLPPRRGSRWNPNSPTNRSRTESEAIIRELGRPVPLGELHEKLVARGVVLGGKNPKWALSANLGRHAPLVSTERGWWLAGAPMPPIHHQVDLLADVKPNGQTRLDA